MTDPQPRRMADVEHNHTVILNRVQDVIVAILWERARVTQSISTQSATGSPFANRTNARAGL